MAEVVALQRGYYGRVIREEGARFTVPDAEMNDPKRRPSWVRRVKGEAAAPANAGDDVSLDALTVKELRDLAEDKGIRIAPGAKKADILKAIEDEGAASAPFADAPAPAPIPAAAVSTEIDHALTGGPQPDWIAPGTDI